MIYRKVSAVVQLRDGFLLQPLERILPQCLIDGVPCPPQVKPGGYLVWTDLPVGLHELTLSLPGFHTEVLTIESREQGIWQGCADLKPAADYRMGRDAVHLHLQILHRAQPLSEQSVWLATVDKPLFKLAQSRAEAGCERLRLFCVHTTQVLPIPGAFLLEDRTPELVFLQTLSRKAGILGAPLSAAHVRGRALSPARQYRTDAQGGLSVLLREPAKLAVFYAGMVRYVQADGKQIQIDFT